MTIEEYLKIVNGVPLDAELTGEMIEFSGFTDVLPDAPNAYSAFPATFSVAGAYLIARRRIITAEKEDKILELVTPLKDDLSMHLKDYKTVEETLMHTIVAFNQMQESNNRIAKSIGEPQPDLTPIIRLLEAYLAKVKAESMEEPTDTVGL